MYPAGQLLISREAARLRSTNEGSFRLRWKTDMRSEASLPAESATTLKENSNSLIHDMIRRGCTDIEREAYTYGALTVLTGLGAVWNTIANARHARLEKRMTQVRVCITPIHQQCLDMMDYDNRIKNQEKNSSA